METIAKAPGRPKGAPFHSALFSQKGFSLLELLAAMVIAAVIMSLAALSVHNMTRSADLGTSAALFSDALNLARQNAQSRNRPVEVRFYRVPARGQPVSSPPATFTYRAMALYVLGDGGPEALGKLLYFNGKVQLSDTQAYGPLLYYGQSGQAALSTLDSTGNTLFDYRSFVFHSDGSTSLASETPDEDSWHAMLYDPEQAPGDSGPPANYATVQVDPETGLAEIFRP